MSTPVVTAFMRICRALRARNLLVDAGNGIATGSCPNHKPIVSASGKTLPTLRCTRIEGSVLIHCGRGCSALEVMRALGMDCRHLYDRPGRATYVYTDEEGNPIRYVHRMVSADGSKTFRQSYPSQAAAG